MRNDKKRWALCLAAAMSFSLTIGMNFYASEDAAEETVEEAVEDVQEEVSDDPYYAMDGNRNYAIDLSAMTDESWSRLAMIDDDKVETGVYIRETAAEDGKVTACLYRGGVVEVVDKGSEWSEIKSGDVWGYIHNEYLVFGSDIKGLVDYYGIEGVRANWDDVCVFEEPDANAKTIYWAIADEMFPVVEDQGHWQSIRLKTAKMSEEQLLNAGLDPEDLPKELLAYVSIEDVYKVVLLDTAVAMETDESEEETESEEEEANEEESYDDSYDNSYDDSSSYNNSYTETPSYNNSGSSNSGNTNSGGSTYTPPATEVPSTDAPSTDTPSTDAPSTDTPSTDTPSTDAPSTDAPTVDDPGTSDDPGSVDDGGDYVDDGSDVGDDVYYDDSPDGDGSDEEYEEIEEIEDAEEYAQYSEVEDVSGEEI